MTTSKYEESIKELGSQDDTKKLKALRFIKNSVIGNKTKKELYIKLGVVQRLVEYLSCPDNGSYQLKIQAATILGSIAYGKDENVSAVVTSGAVTPLLNTLSLPRDKPIMESIQERRKLLEATTRALKAIFASSRTLKYDTFSKKHIEDLVLILEATSNFLGHEPQGNVSSEGLSFAMIAEFTAAIIAKCCDTQIQQSQLEEAGVIQPLINLLHSGCIKAQEASLDAIATLCRENKELGETIINSKSLNTDQITTNTMLDFVKDKCPNMRLIAATCLTNLYRTGVFSEPFNEIILIVLPALVKLLQDPTDDVQERAPLVLADLIKDSEEMQKAAFDADAISRLAELLASVSSKDSEEEAYPQLGVPGLGSVTKRKEKIKENSLIAIAAATLLKEECRTQAIEARVLPHVISGLTSRQPNVRLAACQCAKSLSRSVSHLRTSLVDAGIAPPLIKLLQDDSLVIQAAACGALCNLVLDFSPMKKCVIEAGAISRFVEYSQSDDTNLQLNGLWALKNQLFRADLQAKKAVMDVLTYDALIELLHEPNPTIQEQALEIVRNLVYGKQEDTDWVIEGIGKDDLLDVLESKLQVTSAMGLEDEVLPVTLVPALYIVVNMSSNAEAPKMALMSRSNIVNSVIHHLVRS
ncbi:armadillo-type protein [Mucor mucedo]|uniref:armadillo-type protein n=1 Tax=Mucor mucedo TaxID=29922 RepID=UPI002220A119|nr:armadillo-type protein [Mucor mucedo]KAI7892329.1 armadillo-type protein [Mucor mucedo]